MAGRENHFVLVIFQFWKANAILRYMRFECCCCCIAFYYEEPHRFFLVCVLNTVMCGADVFVVSPFTVDTEPHNKWRQQRARRAGCFQVLRNDIVCTLPHFSISVLGEYSMRVDIVCCTRCQLECFKCYRHYCWWYKKQFLLENKLCTVLQQN